MSLKMAAIFKKDGHVESGDSFLYWITLYQNFKTSRPNSPLKSNLPGWLYFLKVS